MLLKKKKVFHTPNKKVDYSHLSAKEQAKRMAEDYAKLPTSNSHLSNLLKDWSETYKEEKI